MSRQGTIDGGDNQVIGVVERSEQCGVFSPLCFQPLSCSVRGANTVLNPIPEKMRHILRSAVHNNTPLSQRAFATKQSTHWPRIAIHHCHRAILHPKITIRTMASIHIDDKVKALINNSYPQTQEAGDDPHKLSTSAYPHVEVRLRDISEITNTQLTIVTVLPA
jgi:hypothetical protein